MAADPGKQISALLNDLGKRLTEVMGKGRDEARRMARAAQIGLEITTLTAQRVKLLEDLGSSVYEGFSKPGRSKKAHGLVAQLLAQVAELDRRVASLKRALKNAPSEEAPAKRRGRPPKAAAGGAEKPRRGRPPKKGKKGKPGRPPKAGKRGKPGRPPKKAKAARRGRPPRKAAAVPPKVKAKAPRKARAPRKPPAPAAPAPAPETEA